MNEEGIKCPACGLLVPDLTDEEKDKPVAVYEKCPRCRKWNWLLRCLVLVAVMIALVIGIWFRFGWMKWIGLVGLISTILGAFFLGTGYQRILVSIGTWGSYKQVEKYLPSLTQKIRMGIILLVLGFLMQAIYLA